MDIPGVPPSSKETIEIPLSEIWAWRMPGTRDIGELETSKPRKYAYGPLVGEIRRALAKPRPKGEEAKQGFAVVGTGMEALRKSHAVLVKDGKYQQKLPFGSDISLVFFSYQSGSYVKLDSVTLQGERIDIYYSFVAHRTRNVTTHFAFIPFNNLSPGKYIVKISESPTASGSLESNSDWGKRLVCKSFSFSIVDQGKP